MWILFSLGLGRGEALGLKWADVDFRNGVIRTELQYKIVGNDTELGPLKTTMSVRPNAMSEGLRVKLLAQLERQADWKLQCDDAWQDWGLVITTSVGTPMHPRNVNRLLADLADKAGIRHISSHVGRRTNITGQIRAGVPLDVVAARAGHRSSITTIRAYRTVLEDEKRAGGFDLEGYRKSGARTDTGS